VAGTSATLNALLDANGQPSTVAFEYDTQASFLSANVVQAGAFGGLNEETASVYSRRTVKESDILFPGEGDLWDNGESGKRGSIHHGKCRAGGER
jgi:hypothetical protein